MRLILALCLYLLLAGCGNAVYLANRASAVASADLQGLDAQDRDDLAAGRLAALHDRYADRPAAGLSTAQLALLCDVLLKYAEFGRADACLTDMETRLKGDAQALSGDAAARLAGKRALLALSSGRAEIARDLTRNDPSEGGRYVNALAALRLGDFDRARATADAFRVTFRPLTVYFAASLYAGLGDYGRARATLEDPERRLLRDYGLSASADIFGNRIGTAPFRLDIFDEFSFGLLGTVSFSPAANVYVEYLAGHVYLRNGGYQEAERRLDAVLNFPAIEAYRDVLWRALLDRAELADRAGDPDAAIRLLRRATDVIETIRSSLSTESGRIAVQSDKDAPYARLVDLLVRRGDTQEALRIADRAHGRALVELLSARKDFGASRPGAATLNRLVADLDRTGGEAITAAATAPGTTRERLAAIETARRRVLHEAPDAADLVTVAPIDIPAVQRALGPDEAALIFFKGAAAWHVFAITRTGLTQHAVPDSDVTPATTALTGALKLPVSPNVPQLGQTLYARLLAPVLDGLHASSLVIVPSGPLYYLPFAAIHDGHGYLVDRFAIRVLPSLGLLGHPPAAHTDAAARSLVIGNPQRDNPEYNLVFAEREAREVASLVPDPTLVLGPDATVPDFQRLARDRSLIHYAGHGQFSSNHPLESGLLLAGPGGKIDLLSTRQLYDLQISAKLVFLSACETALGAVGPGQDLIGLQRGFFYAGATSLIASLWTVDDAATARLVHEFYAEYLHHTPAQAALQIAQIKTREAFPHPYYWAPFIVAASGAG